MTESVLRFALSPEAIERLDNRERAQRRMGIIRRKSVRLRIASGPENPVSLNAHLQRMFATTMKNALVRGISFDLPYDSMMRIGNGQQWRCAVTGMHLSLNKISGCSRRPFAPSIDRIDSAKGYTVANVRIVCVAVNLAMNEWGDKVFHALAVAYAEKAGLTTKT